MSEHNTIPLNTSKFVKMTTYINTLKDQSPLRVKTCVHTTELTILTVKLTNPISQLTIP